VASRLARIGGLSEAVVRGAGRPLAAPGCPPRGEPLVAPCTQQQRLGAERFVELDLGPRFAVIVANLRVIEDCRVEFTTPSGRYLYQAYRRRHGTPDSPGDSHPEGERGGRRLTGRLWILVPGFPEMRAAG